MSSVFPATYSTLSADALAALISDRYEINCLSCKLLAPGVGDTYLAETDKTQYILRVYRSSHRTGAHVLAEIQLLLAIHQAGVPVSYPIADKDGTAIQSMNAVEGERYAVLFSYAPGVSESILNEKQLYELGYQMARFHSVSASIELKGERWLYNEATTLTDPLRILQPYLDSDTYTWLESAVNDALAKLTLPSTRGFSSGYIHFDLMPKNFHFEEDRITFFDFDFMGYGWLVNDLMTFQQQLCVDVHFGKMTQESADKSFSIMLEGYQAVRSISDEELAAIPYLSLGFWLFYSAFHTTHDQFRPFIQPSHLKARFAMIRKMLERQIAD
jgi:Ser/Thr protein kinase RdoA (MazF antagonist)